MKRDKEKMIRDDKQDFYFVGFQDENADTIPSEIPCKPVVYLDRTASGHTPTEHHIRKKQLFYSQMTRLHQNDNLNYSRLLRPVAPSPREKQKQREKLQQNLLFTNIRKYVIEQLTFLVVSKAFFFLII